MALNKFLWNTDQGIFENHTEDQSQGLIERALEKSVKSDTVFTPHMLWTDLINFQTTTNMYL